MDVETRRALLEFFTTVARHAAVGWNVTAAPSTAAPPDQVQANNEIWPTLVSSRFAKFEFSSVITNVLSMVVVNMYAALEMYCSMSTAVDIPFWQLPILKRMGIFGANEDTSSLAHSGMERGYV